MTTSPPEPRARRSPLGVAALGVLSILVACVASTTTDPLARYAAVHNTLAAMGMVQTGPIQRGSLAEGRAAKLEVDLPIGCTTLVTMGGTGVDDIDLELKDGGGKLLAKDTTRDAEAAVRVCVDEAGKYNVSVKMAKGAGAFLAATWSGGDLRPKASSASSSNVAASTQGGSCDAPSPLGPGVTQGSTAHGEALYEGSCGTSSAKEVVYRLDVPVRQRVAIEVEPRFDAVLYLRKDCTDPGSEVACNDDVQGRASPRSSPTRPSKVDEVLDPGTYYVFVDGYEDAEGAFKITVSAREVPTLAEACRRALPLVPGAQVTGSTTASFDHAHAKCGDDAKGADMVYRLDIPSKSRVRVVEHGDFAPVVHVRQRCAEEATEVGCSSDAVADEEAAYTGLLEAGSYAVFADSTSSEHAGRFTLKAETAPEQGLGTSGESCSDAVPISSIQSAVVEGDTFPARDDVVAKCGAPGGPDVVYRVEVAKRSRFRARLVGDEGSHVLALARGCGEATAQLACGTTVDEVIVPGTYYLLVDAKTASSFGRFKLEVRSGEVGPQEAACKNPPELRPNVTTTGTTVGAGDRFTISCAGPVQGQGSPDRMYKIVLATRSRVKLELATPTWDGVLAIRRTCLDAVTGPRGSEVGCNNDANDEHHAKLETTLEAGTYFVHVDGHQTGNQGPFTLTYTATAAR